MLICISIETIEPFMGTAAAGRGAPVPFVGWLELLRTISELVDADDRRTDRSRATDEDLTERTGGDQDLS
ncbi:MAG: hypothetical protein H0V51_01975 [Chloroflexi bacterium]|nr:hypothetical protein [Chloroflexota bacterium]